MKWVGKAAMALLDAVLIGALVYAYMQWPAYQHLKAMHEASQSVVLLESPEGVGSGVMIAPGRMLTSAHVITSGDLDDWKVWRNGVEHKVYEIEWVNEDVDVAVVGVILDCPCAEMIKGDPRPLQPTFTIGYPGNHVIPVVTEGRWQGKDDKYIDLVTSSAAPGNSGGGLFVKQNGKPRLAGIVKQLTGTDVRHQPWPLPLPPMQTPVYYLVGVVNQWQIKQAIMCADTPGSMWCGDPFDAESGERSEEERTTRGAGRQG